MTATLASVLVRRGYADPAAARAFLEGALPGHDPAAARRHGRGRCDDPGRRRGREADLRPRRLRRRRDLRDRARGLPASRARRRPRLAPAVPVRGGIRARRPDDLAKLAEDGVELVLTVDCGITAVAEVAEARTARARGRRHRPPPPRRRVPRPAPSSRRSRATTRSPASAAPRSCGSSPRRSSAPDHPFLDRHLDIVALATVADVVPLVDENRALALAGLRRLAQTQKPGLQLLMRVAGVDPAACNEGAIGFSLAPRINASGRLGRPEAALALLLSDDARRGEAAGRAARGSQPGAAGGRGEDPARRDRRDRVVARAAPPPPRVRRRRARTGTRA